MPRAVLRLEAIGEDAAVYLKALRRGQVRQPNTLREIRARRLAGTQPYVLQWFALEPSGRVTKQRLVPKHDYTQARGAGSRGVWLYYVLDEGGLYEIEERLSWQRSRHYYATVRAGQMVEITQEDALRCLSTNAASV